MWKFAKLDRSVHDRSGFDCGVPPLNEWLQKQAAQKMDKRLVHTWVASPLDAPAVIAGYASLTPHHITIDQVPPEYAKMIPHGGLYCVMLPRLAVSLNFRKKGLGEDLLGYAIDQAQKACEFLPYRFLIVDAKDANAKAFYVHMGFTPFSTESMRLYVALT